MPKTIVFVSCGKTKAPEARTARFLGTFPQFSYASSCADQISSQWFVLSKKYGVVHSEEIIASYEKILIKIHETEKKSLRS